MPEVFLPYSKPLQDGRRKIDPKDHERIRRFYRSVKSQRVTAKRFNVSRRLIVFILYPERYKKRLAERKQEQAHLKYYDRAVHTQAISKYRKKKRKLGFRE